MLPASTRRLLDEVRAANAEGNSYRLADGRRVGLADRLIEEGVLLSAYRPNSFCGRRVRYLDLKVPSGTAARVRRAKAGGDDRYSWCVWVDGRCVASGEDSYQSSWIRRRVIRRLAAGARS